MQQKIIKSKRPKCKYCGVPMREWNPFSNWHAHMECEAEDLANRILSGIEKDLESEKA